MKKIIYKTPAEMFIMDENGDVVGKNIVGVAERPYSESNLEYVKSVALNGEYEIYDDGEPDSE